MATVVNFNWNKSRSKILKFSISGTSLPWEVDITSMEFEFAVKKDYDDTTNLITKSSTNVNEIQKITPTASGQFYVYLTSGDGANLVYNEEYYYDVMYTQSGSYNIAESGQLVEGKISIKPSVKI